MYKLCKTEQSANRQRQLEQGLLQVMMTTRFDEISISDLCDRLNIPRKAFYRYFNGKEGALHALLDHTLMDCKSFPEIYADREKRTLEWALEQFFLFWVQQKNLLDALQRSNLSGVLIERAVAQATVEAKVARGGSGIEEQRMQRYVTVFSVYGLMSIVLQWHHGGYAESARMMASAVIRLMTKPLVPNDNRSL